MNDEPTPQQNVAQLVERLANEMNAVRAEMTSLKDSLARIEADVHDLEARVDRLETRVERLEAGRPHTRAPGVEASGAKMRKSLVFQYTTSRTSLQRKLDVI
jgi:outer membrane murein-binding lipoprotein Lpp